MENIQAVRSPDEQAAYAAELERLRNPGLLDLWSGFLDTGLATSQGNAKTTSFNLSLNTARTSPRDKISVAITSLYARSNTTGTTLTTANAIRGGIRYDVNIRPRLFGFGSTDLEYDQFQGLDLRFVPAAGMGFHWVKTDRTRFDLFAGGALNREFYIEDINRTSGEVVLGEELFHQLTKALQVEHKLVVYPNVSDVGKYRVNFDTALATRLSGWLAWQLALSDRLNTNPIPGKKKNDLLFTTGLRFNFQ
jgi:putative salt-induced outer membrane protein YdiY